MLAAAFGCGDSGTGASASSTGLSVGSGSTGTSDATQGVPTTSETGGGTTSTSAGSVSGSSGEATTSGVTTGEASTGGGSSGTTGAVSEGGTSTTEAASSSSGGPVDFCDGQGGILLPGDLSDMCTADLGKKTFLFAVCSCNGLTANNTLKTDSFDSEMMGMMPMDGGSVGVNGMYSASSFYDIGGSLWVDGPIQNFNSHEVAQDVQCGGDYSAVTPATVGDDVFIEGNLVAQNKVLTIGGDLHIAAGKSTAGANVLGKIIKEPVAVKTPCNCDDPIDVAAIVQGYQTDNDNIPMAIEPNQLIGNPQPETLELPCGRYYFDAITPNNTLTIKLTGRTVIAVAGDIVTPGAFALELGPDAELDLFVAGNVTLNNTATIGDTARPAATRIYVQQAFKFSSNFVLGANLYQPNATFTANNMAEIWGSLFVGGLTLSSPFTVHYDQAILELDGCSEGGGCGDCHDCANPTPACKDGTCAPCQLDSDCCPPLVCDQGLCKAIEPG